MHTATNQPATHQIVGDYLNDLEHLLQHADATSVAVMAPTELARTIHALRAILADHEPESPTGGHSGPIGQMWRKALQQVGSSRAWHVAYQHLIAAAPADPTGPIKVVGGPR